jgi:hypothetical protein
MNDDEKLLRLVIKQSLDESKKDLFSESLIDPSKPLFTPDDFSKMLAPFQSGKKIGVGGLRSIIAGFTNFLQNNVMNYTDEEIDLINKKHALYKKNLNNQIEKEFKDLTKDSNFNSYTFLNSPGLYIANFVPDIETWQKRYEKFEITDEESLKVAKEVLQKKDDELHERILKFRELLRRYPVLSKRQDSLEADFDDVLSKASSSKSSFNTFLKELSGREIKLDYPEEEDNRNTLIRKKILLDFLKKNNIINSKLYEKFTKDLEEKITSSNRKTVRREKNEES